MKPDELKTQGEWYDYYREQGCDHHMAQRRARERFTRQVIQCMKEDDPAAYAQLQQKVQAMQAEEERKRQEALDVQRLAEERARIKRDRIEHAVMCAGTPIPVGLFSKPGIPECFGIPVEGDVGEVLLSVRSWDVDVYGYLHGVGAGSHYRWKEFNVADRVPSERNDNGFYSVRLDSHGLVFGGLGNYISRAKCCGLISLSGRVVEHDDDVLRAECATIKCIWYVGDAPEVYVDVPLLMEHYPTTPVFVCTQRQVAEALVMVMMLSGMEGES